VTEPRNRRPSAGRARGEPTSRPPTGGDGGYVAALAAAKAAIQSARTRAVLAVNSELISLYWDLGRLILDRQAAEGPRTKVITRLSSDLRAEFPGMKGLSPGNLDYMRRLAAAWPDRSSLRLVGNIPWGHNQLLLDKLDAAALREWYARSAIEHGWSRVVLQHQIMSQLHRRQGAALSNFARVAPAGDSELMQQATKDPYALEFLTIAGDAHERDVEQAMIDQLDRVLREFGRGFAYVGRQHRLAVGDDEFFIDLLMFNWILNRFVVVELKHRKFTPADVGQLNFYLAAVDDLIRQDHHAPTLGLLLCTGRNEGTVRYALSGTTNPMAVAGYRYTELPAVEQAVMPDEDDLLGIVAHALDESTE
jgi:predicted nuclease of restriction endonuclease-like (RecB) superfamily